MNMTRTIFILGLLGMASCENQGQGYHQMVDTKAPDMAYSTSPSSGVEHATDAGTQSPEGPNP